MKQCMDDWSGVKDMIAERYMPEDPEPERASYSEWTPRHAWISGSHPIGVDTESHAGIPWSVQVSGIPHFGVLYRTDNAAAMEHFRWMMSCQEEIVLHNAAYDLEVLRRLKVPVKSFRDTMQEAYHLGNLPQGLKPLVYRLFRHTMTSYEETVRPASVRKLTDWMTEAFMIAQADLSYTERIQLKTKVRETVHKGELETLLTRLLRLTAEESGYDPWERLNAFWSEPVNEWMVRHVEARIGSFPAVGIANCTMEEAVKYAVGDADWTGRVAVELQRRRAGSFRIYEGDRDA
jgi:hypothetical protein